MAGQTPENAAWEDADRRIGAIERVWPDPVARQRAILDCRIWLSAQTHVPHLARLAELLRPEMDLPQLWTLRVPVERANARRRVTDVDLLEHDRTDLGELAPPMALTLVVDCLRSAFNLGGILRTAECFGAAAVWTCGYTAPPSHPQVAAAAMGAERLVPWRAFERVADAVAALHAAGATVVALETTRTAVALGEHLWRFPCGLLLGNERFGLDPQTLQQADATVRIPLHGRKNSLNVVSACALAAYAARQAWNGP